MDGRTKKTLSLHTSTRPIPSYHILIVLVDVGPITPPHSTGPRATLLVQAHQLSVRPEAIRTYALYTTIHTCRRERGDGSGFHSAYPRQPREPRGPASLIDRPRKLLFCRRSGHTVRPRTTYVSCLRVQRRDLLPCHIVSNPHELHHQHAKAALRCTCNYPPNLAHIP